MSQIADVINLVVNINGNAAQNQLNELRKKSADLTSNMKGLKKRTQEYITASADLKKVNTDIDDLKKSIGLTSLSFKELASEKRKFTALRDSQVPLSKEYKDYDQELQKVILRQKELSNSYQGLGKVQSTFSGIGSSIKLLAASYIGFFAITNGIKSLISGTIKLSDQLGDLRRVTGLTKDEANNLYKSLLQIDTRTSGASLLSIAIIAGKLGVAKGDILSFTEATNKLVVTLGDELGDADNITTQLGKILNVFDGTITSDNITHLGNAIVDLANKGVATGPFIVDFTQRVAGIAKASNISLGSTVGLAAAFEGLGLRSQSSATALQKLILTISQDIPKAAEIAGVPLAEFNKLFADKPQEALIKFAEGLVKNKTAFTQIANSFKDAGEEGARVVTTLLAIGQRGEYVREQMDLGNKSIKEQTALNEGFAIKNDNLAGSIEKLSKEFDKLVANEGVQKFLQGIVNILGSAISEVDGLVTAFNKMNDSRVGEVFSRVGEGLKALILHGPAGLKALNDARNALKGAADGVQSDKGKDFVLPADTAPAKTTKTAINDLTDTSDSKKSNDGEYKRLLKEAQDFYKSLQKLKEDAANADKSQDVKDLINLEQKYNDLHAKALEYFKKNVTDRKTYTAEEKLIVEAFNNELAALQKKQFEARSGEEYNRALKDTENYFDEQKHLESENYTNGLQSKEQYDANIHALDVQSKAQMVQVATDYSGTVKKAAGDETKFKKEQLDQQDSDDRNYTEKRIQYARNEALAKAQLAVLAAPKESRERDNAQKKLLQTQFDLDPNIQKFAKTSEQYKEKEQELQDALAEIDEQAKQRRIRIAENYAQGVLSITDSLITALNNIDQRELQRDEAKNEAKKNNYKKQLDAKLISQKKYDLLTAKSDEELDKKKQEIANKQAKRQKAEAVFQAIINTASAIAEALPNIPLSILSGLIGAAQIVAIETTSSPQAAEGNWFREGDKHSDPSGGIPVMIERDEAVVKAKAMTDSNRYTVSGTPSQITSKLNSMHGGVNWAAGAVVNMPKFREPGPQISPKIARIMSQGGLVSGAVDKSINENSSLQKLQILKLEELITEVKNQKERLHAVVSIKEYRDKEKQYDNAKKAAGMGG